MSFFICGALKSVRLGVCPTFNILFMDLHKANGTVLGSINGTEKANIME